MIVVEEPKSNSDSDTMIDIDNYEDSSAQANDDIMHPYLTLTVREIKESYMATLKPYTDEVKDTCINALKANLKGVIVRMKYWRVAFLEQSTMELDAFIRDEKFRRTQKNKKNKAVDEDYTTPIVDEDGSVVDADEIHPLVIVDEKRVVVDEYFAKKVNEVVEEIKKGEKDQVEEKMVERKKKKKRRNWKRMKKKKKKSWKRRNRKKMKRRRLKRRNKNKN
ncbi:hypothetical protein H5410_050483 [Solanum commersonii]|uniref:Uncharacterized protein n=1 Tax=Solanum commersonii TaxID=4109 RepID=A0A9J5WY04_SOLCO|nr:hypothetical protein H5410_050483 [Solanum commersonii]